MPETSARPIRVLQLIGGCAVGGLEKVALNLVTRLSGDHEFRVVAFDETDGPMAARFAAAGAPVTLLRRRRGVDLLYPFRLARFIRREKIDVVHAHNRTAFFYGGLAAALAGGKPLVFTAHDRTFPQVPSKPVQRFLGRRTRYAVAVSELGRRDLLSVDGFEPERVVIVRNGVDAEELRGRPLRDEARRALGLPEDAEVVGTIARLHPEKNLAMLVRAFAAVLRERPRALLVIAGDGPDRAALDDAARAAGLGPRAVFLGRRDDVGRVLAAMDVFVLTSDREGLPLAVLEAMGAERPVVATDVGAVGEVVRDGENGWLVPAGDERAVAAALSRTLSDPRRAEAMGRRGGEIFRSAYTLERMASGYGRVYKEAMEGVV
ncbi:MAG: N-acetyl-alpha-D-glucosaminyl L-malate synthase [Planctomycetes bacterium]|nr:N-acetyl-alpha-D-glucosaminyl L-malate synthase [Planctomycetota bacterium]